MFVTPTPAPDCKYDFTYVNHGEDWVCNCNEGLE